METKEVLRIQNLNEDIISSGMLDDFKTQFSRYEGVQFIEEEHITRDNEKGIVFSAVSFLLNVAAGVASGLIIEFLKNVYTRHKKPEEYEWEVAIELDSGSEKVIYKVIIYKENGMVAVQKVGAENPTTE